MNILYITQYFPPEKGAAQTRAWEMAKSLSQAGHKIAVLTEFPNYPSGIVPSRYRFKFFEKEIYHGLEVIRVYAKSSPKKNFVTRMLFYLSFLLFSIVGAMKLKDRYDLIYATSPPLFVGLSGYVINRLKKTKFVFEVRDLWPESAVAIGALKNKTAIKISHQLADLCYKQADKVIVVTRGIYNYLKKRKLGAGKLCIIPNGINLPMFNHSQNNASYKKESGYYNKFIVLYAGLLGLAQGIETLVEAAKLLRRKEEVLFLFVGNGPLREKLIRLQKSNRLENLLIINDMPRKEVIKYITLADCCLVPLKKAEIFKTALPSKMFDAWACKKPIILSVDGEAREHLEKAKAGIYVEPEDSQGIANAIKFLFDNPQLCKEYGNNGRNYVKQHFSRKVQTERLEKILLEVLRRAKRIPKS